MTFYPYDPLMMATVLIPIVTAAFIYVLGRGSKSYPKYAALACAGIVLLLSLMLIPAVQDYSERGGYQRSYGINGPQPIAQFGPNGAWKIFFDMKVDGLSLIIMITISIVTLLAILFSIEYHKKKPIENENGYYASMLLFAAGMAGVLYSTDMIQFYMFWELMLVPSYLLVTFWGERSREECKKVGLKYFIYTHVGAVLILLGIMFVIAMTRSTNIIAAGADLNLYADKNMVKIAAALFFIGFGIKMGVFPFHSWIPDTYSTAAPPAAVMIAGAMSAIGVYGLARFAFTLFPRDVLVDMMLFVMLAALATQIYGALMALSERDLRRFLAYSSISQMGYILFGIGTVASIGVGGSVLQAVNNGLVKSLLFMGVGAIFLATSATSMDELGGLAGKMPFTAFAVIVGALALAGIPPLCGFVSEWMILAGGFGTAYTALAMAATVASILTMGYSLWFIKRVFFGEMPMRLDGVKEIPFRMLVPAGALALLCILIGIAPGAVTQFIDSWLGSLGGLGGW